MSVAAAGGGAASGPVMAGDGYGTLAATGRSPPLSFCRWPGPGPPPGLAVNREHRAAFSAILPRRLTRSRLRDDHPGRCDRRKLAP
jgi:hypothetical protein